MNLKLPVVTICNDYQGPLPKTKKKNEEQAHCPREYTQMTGAGGEIKDH